MSNTLTTDNTIEHPRHLIYEEECGWYTFDAQKDCESGIKLECEPSDDTPINPYGYEYLSPIQKGAVDYAKKMNTECPTIFKKLYDTLKYFFGNRKENDKNGLYKQYDRIYYAVKYHLEMYPHSNELVGLILWGADVTHPCVKITDYNKPDGETITLTIQSICYNLIKKHIKDENLDYMCSGTLRPVSIEYTSQDQYSLEWGHGLYNQ